MTAFETARELWTARIQAQIASDYGRAPARPNSDFNYSNGWITVGDESFNGETLFPDQHWPRFPADQGVSD